MSISVAILLFCWYTAITDPQLFAILIVTVVLAWVFEAILARSRKRTLAPS